MNHRLPYVHRNEVAPHVPMLLHENDVILMGSTELMVHIAKEGEIDLDSQDDTTLTANQQSLDE